MFAIYDKSSNRFVCRYYGEEANIKDSYDQYKFGYVLATEAEFSGDPKEYEFINGKPKRRNIDEILAEIESTNPLLKELNRLKQENSLLGQQAFSMDVRLMMGGM